MFHLCNFFIHREIEMNYCMEHIMVLRKIEKWKWSFTIICYLKYDIHCFLFEGGIVLSSNANISIPNKFQKGRNLLHLYRIYEKKDANLEQNWSRNQSYNKMRATIYHAHEKSKSWGNYSYVLLPMQWRVPIFYGCNVGSLVTI